jgi:hypothetical protein
LRLRSGEAYNPVVNAAGSSYPAEVRACGRGSSLSPAAVRAAPKSEAPSMPSIGNVARLHSEPTYRELQKALSELLTWLSARPLAQAQEDLSGLGDLLRRLWAPLKAASATETLETWRSSHGRCGWANTSAEGLILKTAKFAEGVSWGRTRKKLAAGHAKELAVMLGPESHFDEPRWIDFREAVKEYAAELLGLLRPAGLNEDPEAVEAMREAIQRRGKTAKSDDLVHKCGVGKQRALAALRWLESRGEYEGFAHQVHRRNK